MNDDINVNNNLKAKLLSKNRLTQSWQSCPFTENGKCFEINNKLEAVKKLSSKQYFIVVSNYFIVMLLLK